MTETNPQEEMKESVVGPGTSEAEETETEAPEAGTGSDSADDAAREGG